MKAHLLWQMPEILECVARFLRHNDVALSLRPVNKAAAAVFKAYTTVHLSRAVPHFAFKHWCTAETMRLMPWDKRWILVQRLTDIGCLPNIELAIQEANFPTSYSSVLMCRAAAAGHVHVCQFLRDKGVSWDWALSRASEHGQVKMCWWLLNNGCSWDSQAPAAAMRCGHINLARWLMRLCRKLQPEWMFLNGLPDYLAAAARTCDLPTLQQEYREWLGQEEPPNKEPFEPHVKAVILSSAARSLTADWQKKILWLESCGYPRREMVCQEAACCPDAPTRLQWLRGRGYPMDETVVHLAADKGNVLALEYILSLDDIDVDLYTGEAEFHAVVSGHGQLSVLQMLHARGLLRKPAEDFEIACMHGDKSVMDWLFNLLPLEEHKVDLCTLAVLVGDVDLLCRLREQLGGLDVLRDQPDILTLAAGSRCLAVLEMVLEAGCPMPDDGSPFAAAAGHDDLTTLQWLLAKGCPWGPPGEAFAMAIAKPKCVAEHSCVQSLRWLKDAGCSIDVVMALQVLNHEDFLFRRSAVLEVLGLNEAEAAVLTPPVVYHEDA